MPIKADNKSNWKDSVYREDIQVPALGGERGFYLAPQDDMQLETCKLFISRIFYVMFSDDQMN